MIKSERLEKITDYIKINTSATIQELVEVLKVSHMTIRRDVKTLEEEEILNVIHGGVIYNAQHHSDDYKTIIARTSHLHEKEKIALQAITYIKPNDSIIIDAGSTGELIATFLPTNMPLTIVCYALNIATIIAKKPNCTLILSGGHYHESSMSFESNEGLELLKQNRVNIAFITANGVSSTLGITCSAYFERLIKHTALKSSKMSILVADSSKFDVIKPNHFANIEDFDIIITDKGLNGECASSIKGKTTLVVT